MKSKHQPAGGFKLRKTLKLIAQAERLIIAAARHDSRLTYRATISLASQVYHIRSR